MAQEYDKLIRDRIPDIIRREGRECVVEVMSEQAYCAALRRKLVEEASEAHLANDTDLLTELADLTEVLDALLVAYPLEPRALRDLQQRRRVERAGFNKRLRLTSVHERQRLD